MGNLVNTFKMKKFIETIGNLFGLNDEGESDAAKLKFGI
jgi:hypothetical protein